MFRFRMEIAGQVQMDRGIARFADGIGDYRGVWPVIADEFRAQVKDQFKSEGAEGGDKWVDLTPVYAKYKEVRWPGKPILERTGDLLSSLTQEGDPNAVYVESRKSLTLGSKVSYAIYHQTGTKKMAARPEIQLTEQFKRLAMKNVQAYLVEIATRSGFRDGMTPIDTSRVASLLGLRNSMRG